MTENEAIAIFRKNMPSAGPETGRSYIRALVALGVLKLDRPKSPESRFVEAISGMDPERRDSGVILDAIDKAGLKLVEK